MPLSPWLHSWLSYIGEEIWSLSLSQTSALFISPKNRGKRSCVWTKAIVQRILFVPRRKTAGLTRFTGLESTVSGPHVCLSGEAIIPKSGNLPRMGRLSEVFWPAKRSRTRVVMQGQWDSCSMPSVQLRTFTTKDLQTPIDQWVRFEWGMAARRAGVWSPEHETLEELLPLDIHAMRRCLERMETIRKIGWRSKLRRT